MGTSNRTESVRSAPWSEPARCPRCGEALAASTGSRPVEYCGDACRLACSRAVLWLRPLLRYVARLVEGAPVGLLPEYAGLARTILQRERAVARAEVQARRLPAPPSIEPGGCRD